MSVTGLPQPVTGVDDHASAITVPPVAVAGVEEVSGVVRRAIVDAVGRFRVVPNELATFRAHSQATTLANNKALLSLVNASGSLVVVKLRELWVRNPTSAVVTGIAAQLELKRITSVAGATAVASNPYDTADSLNASVTATTGGTVAGEATNPLTRWQISTDEWGPGTLDVESAAVPFFDLFPFYRHDPMGYMRPITLRANQGLSLIFRGASTAGALDIGCVFTQE